MSRQGTKPMSKASTKPPRTGGPSSRGTQRSKDRTRQGTSGGLGVLPEGDDDDDRQTIGTETDIIPRARYQPPTSVDPTSFARFRDYLKKTEIEWYFRNLLKMLLDRPELPYNPYPGFVIRLRHMSERFHLESESVAKIEDMLTKPIEDTYVQNLYTQRGSDEVWGLSSIVRAVSVPHLRKYRWLVDDVTPALDDLYTTPDYSNQVMAALVGPLVFEGTFFAEAHIIQIRLEYLVTGPEVSQGISVFVNSVMADIDTMLTSPFHILVGVNVPTSNPDYPDQWMKVFWDPEKIEIEKEVFLQKLSDAVIGNKYIYMECIFLLDPEYPAYMKGEKQYGLNFIEVIDEIREEGLSSFCEFPMASLHEGVFFHRSHAEAYISIFQPQLSEFDESEPQLAGVAMSPAMSTRRGIGSRLQTGRVSALSHNQRFSVSQSNNVSNVQRHVHNRLSRLKPRRVMIDGFRYGDENTGGPYAWQITTPIKSDLQRRIASQWREAELLESVYCAILLFLLDRDAYERELLIELYRILHGTAGRLYLLTEHNRGLRASILALSNTENYRFVRTLLVEYRNSAERLFVNSLQERSHDQVTVGQAIVAQVDDWLRAGDAGLATSTYIQKTLRGLKNLNWYCLTLLVELSEDGLFRCPVLQELIKTMKATFPDEAERPEMRIRQRLPHFRAGEAPPNLDEEFKHGIEDEQVMKHETSILNMKICMDRDMAPKSMTKESVLMKYMIESHLDEMWSDFLIDLAGGDVYPPNPYPRLITYLRQYTMRMDLCHEKSSAIIERVFNLEVKLEDQENFVYNIPGLDAHGCLTALMLIDTGVYVQLSQAIQHFVQRSYIQKKGTYRVGICLSLTGPAAWYGRMQPYLNSIDLDEHYYIQGPQGCQGEAIQLCALIVYNHILDMIENTEFPVMGVYFGDSASRWSWEDVLNKKRGFIEEFSTICAEKQPIYMKAYIVLDQWRYVPVVKYFKLHFLEHGVPTEVFFPKDESLYYTSVFLSRDRAAFHYQNNGPHHGGNPLSPPNRKYIISQLEKKLRDAEYRCDWVTFYRHLIVRDLIAEDQSHIADAWRMLHSMAAQVEYCSVLMESLQDLVLLFLEFAPFEEQQRAEEEAERRKKKKKGGSRGQSQPSTSHTRKGYQNRIEHKIFNKMVMAFYQKLMYICEARTTMSSKVLPEFMEDKMNSCLEMDPETGETFMVIEDESVFRLEEIKSMLRLLQDTLSADVRSIGTEVTITYEPLPSDVHPVDDVLKPRLASVREKPPSTAGSYYMKAPRLRPSSVTSSILDDPYQYRRRPVQMRTIVEQ